MAQNNLLYLLNDCAMPKNLSNSVKDCIHTGLTAGLSFEISLLASYS
jgi:hypothetical protein